MVEKRGAKKEIRVDVWITKKLAAYLDELLGLEGFGDSPGEICRDFIWKEVNRLIEVGRLTQK